MSSEIVWEEKKMSGIFFGMFGLLSVAVGLFIYVYAVDFPIIALVYSAQFVKTLALLILIIPLYYIGEFYRDEQQTVNLAIGGLGVTMILENIFHFVGMGGTVRFILGSIYGIIMGVTFLMVHRALNSPPDGYGNPFFILYGWLFFIAEMVLIIDTFTFFLGYGVIAVLIQQYISVGLLGIIALKFLADAINRPLLQKRTKTSRQRKSDVYKGVQQQGQYVTSSTKEDLVEEKKEDETVLNYCTFCGAQNFVQDKFCKNCSRELK